MKLLIVDDHELFLAGMMHALPKLDPAAVVYTARDSQAAEKIVKAHNDLALLLVDLSLQNSSGYDLVVRFANDYPTLPIVVVSASEDHADVQKALRLGALGYVPKSSSLPVLLSALRLVLSGGIYAPPHLLVARVTEPSAPKSTHDLRRLNRLTARQKAVLRCVVTGKSNKVIAAELGVTESTVKGYITGIFEALNVTNRTQAALFAREAGLLE